MFNSKIKDSYLLGVPWWMWILDIDHLEEGGAM